MRRKNVATESESGGGLQGHAVGKLKVYTQATLTDGANETTKGFRPASHFGQSRKHNRQIEAGIFAASAALLAGLNLPRTSETVARGAE
jgi:hypothetical protein